MRRVQMDPEGTELATLDRLVSLFGKRVLEIGCGDGRLTSSLAKRARHILAIDPDRRAIGRARRAVPRHLKDRVRFEVGQGESHELPAEGFDVALFSWAL
jgi:2-polyprenyl-3-methyl-5-hydroxy-6-metoxy-1,4-benzoquinol methylase